MFSKSAPLEAAIRIKEEGVNEVDETLQSLGLEIPPQKTIFMFFSPYNKDLKKKNPEGGRGKGPWQPLDH